MNEKKFWDERAESKDVDREVCDPGLIDDCLKEISIGKAKTVLDLGCGVGRLLIPLAKKYPSKKFVGIDVSQKMVDICSGRTKKLKNAFIAQNDGRSLQLPKYKSFDLIYSVAVFQHIPNDAKQSYIAQAKAVLRSGGRLIFQYVEGDQHEFLHYHASEQDVWKWCQEAGFTDIKVKQAIYPNWRWVTAT